MIIRSVDVNNLQDFDFFNDTKDTIGYLHRVGRIDDAKKLGEAFSVWLSKAHNPASKAVAKMGHTDLLMFAEAIFSEMYISDGAVDYDKSVNGGDLVDLINDLFRDSGILTPQ